MQLNEVQKLVRSSYKGTVTLIFRYVRAAKSVESGGALPDPAIAVLQLFFLYS